MATFSKKQVRDAATVAVRQLGYEEMKREQLEVVSGVLNGQDVFAVLPTGFGKSLCFASLPSIYDQLLPLAQRYSCHSFNGYNDMSYSFARVLRRRKCKRKLYHLTQST